MIDFIKADYYSVGVFVRRGYCPLLKGRGFRPGGGGDCPGGMLSGGGGCCPTFTTSALHLAVRVREGDLAVFGWHRLRGRPPTTWLHQICSDCELKPSAALECAQDRSIWWAITTADQATRID